MINPAIFIKEPISFQGICKIYPPSVKEVVTDEGFSMFLRMFTVTQEELEDLNKKQEATALTPFEFLLNCAYNDNNFKKVAEAAFYYFIKERVIFLFEDKKILIGDLEEVV